MHKDQLKNMLLIQCKGIGNHPLVNNIIRKGISNYKLDTIDKPLFDDDGGRNLVMVGNHIITGYFVELKPRVYAEISKSKYEDYLRNRKSHGLKEIAHNNFIKYMV